MEGPRDPSRVYGVSEPLRGPLRGHSSYHLRVCTGLGVKVDFPKCRVGELSKVHYTGLLLPMRVPEGLSLIGNLKVEVLAS